MSDRLDHIESLFHNARMLAPADRGSFLDESCAGQLDLRAEVESYLAHSDRNTVEIDLRPPARNGNGDADGDATLIDRGPLSESAGTRIGPYKILQQIGEGGFGVVYMAEQQEPFQRKVALKIIKLGMDTKQVIARFEAERQALAMMDHPNIARVLEAGATETGRPYFVMELVKGITITDYCDKAKLTTVQRLDLFMQVCQAVQHAHQKGIIHRDIKPSNVLVTLHDTRAVPKVIDFGIAKATSRSLTEKTLFTEFRYFIGTPEYMSPDQAEISGLDVDTRTDIYSLGVLLYELLTGTTPFDSTTLRKAAYGEIQRIIQEVEPPKPSTRVVTLKAEQGTDVARFRNTEPSALGKLMRGDLDWIVMKAMDKDRTRRYQSASEFAGDIERYLAQQPIMAGPPSVLYRMRKFVVRHRIGVMASGLIAAALVVGLSLATLGFFEARQEARRSQRIADFLQDLLVSTIPEQAITSQIDVDEVLATARDVFGEDHATVAATLTARGLQLQSGGDLQAAEDLYREALVLWREQYGDEHVQVGTTLTRLGELLVTKGDDTAAEEALRESIAILGHTSGDARIGLCEPMFVLATLLADRGAYAEAETLLRETLRVRERDPSSQRLQIAMTMSSLANVVIMAGKEDEGATVMAQLIDAWRAALPTNSPFLGRVLFQVGVYFGQREEYTIARRYLSEAELFAINPDAAQGQRIQTLMALRAITRRQGDTLAAIPIALEGLELAREVDGGRHLEKATKDLANLAWDLAGDAEPIEEDYRAGLRAIERALREEPDTRPFINTLGVLQYRLGEYEAALATLARSNALYTEDYETGVPADLAFMAMAHYRLGHEEEARRLLAKVRAAMLDPSIGPSEDNARHLGEAEALIGDQ